VDDLMNYQLGIYFPDHFFLLFTISALVSLGIICFYAKRHPNPHFRPGKREVFMVSLLLVMISGGGCWMAAKLLDSNIDPEKMGAQLDRAQNDAFEKPGDQGGERLLRGADPLPPGATSGDLPEEIRQAIDGN